MKNSLFHILLLLFIARFSIAQETKTVLNPKEIKIGMPFTLTYRVTSKKPLKQLVYVPKKGQINSKESTTTKPLAQQNSIPLPIISLFRDTLYQKNKQFIWEGSYTLTAWDSAYTVILPDSIKLEDSLFIFPPQLLHVTSPKIQPGKPIYDINEMFTKTPPQNKWLNFLKHNWWWMIGCIIILLIVGFILKRRKKTPINKTSIDLLTLTLSEIDKLENAKGYEQNLKEYYYQLSVLLRQFLAEFYQYEIMDKTTAEISHFLKQQPVTPEMITAIKSVLIQSDLVKFAQSRPILPEVRKTTNSARAIVQNIWSTQITTEDD